MDRYRISLLEFKDCSVQLEPEELLSMLKAWRKSHVFAHACSECHDPIDFKDRAYACCCQQFYSNDRPAIYPVKPIAVWTPGYIFALAQLERMMKQANISIQQDFLIFPDPIYWQVPTTLTCEKVLKFVMGRPMTNRTKVIQPPSKAPLFYKQIQEAPLNYGSLESRSCGKATLIRQVAFGKRCRYSMRGMIVPDASLQPNEIRIPDYIVEKFSLRGKWVILNRMPSLQPENFVGLQVPVQGPSWPYECFGIPLEILESINGDFDGDEANIYLVPSLLSQAECAMILNPEWEMKSFVMGMKLAPSQDMLVAWYLFYDEIDFLPIKFPNLKKTLHTICEVYGSRRAYEAFNQMRLFYLDRLQNRICFALTFEEMETMATILKEGGDVRSYTCCLTTQIFAGAKGNFENLTQMFGSVGMQSGVNVKNSFMSGLNGVEAAAHGRTSLFALYLVNHIWYPGYGYQKLMSNGHAMVVSYAGNIIDGTQRIIFKDALDAYHHEDVISVVKGKTVYVKNEFGDEVYPVSRKGTEYYLKNTFAMDRYGVRRYARNFAGYDLYPKHCPYLLCEKDIPLYIQDALGNETYPRMRNGIEFISIQNGMPIAAKYASGRPRYPVDHRNRDYFPRGPCYLMDENNNIFKPLTKNGFEMHLESSGGIYESKDAFETVYYTNDPDMKGNIIYEILEMLVYIVLGLVWFFFTLFSSLMLIEESCKNSTK